MKINLLAASTTLGLALMSNTTQAADGSLTIYSGDYESVAQSEPSSGGPGFALFERKIGFDLKAGDTDVSLGGLPRGMDSSSFPMAAPKYAASVLILPSQDKMNYCAAHLAKLSQSNKRSVMIVKLTPGN